ncbi:tyrosine-type recombinase/integrase [Anaerostipes faecalis]|uniref:tyrosine-type recombinase/integrase n=1 Tax=Anaerostipes faecalis TaxID=2738446 RepID=UPI003F10380B
MNKREKILSEHPFTIWIGKDEKWRTYLYDEKKKNNRRLIKRTSKKAIEDAIVEEYKRKEDKCETFRDIFPKWIQYKRKHTNSTSYIARIIADWNKFYENSSIVDVPLKNLRTINIDEWAHETIQSYGLTKKSYYNMSIILRQGLQYAVDCDIIDVNPMEELKIQKKLFVKSQRQIAENEVFTIDEEKEIIKIAIDDFLETGNTTCLSIVLNFQLGLRIGELCALMLSDFNIDKRVVHIQRMEVKDFKITVDEKGVVSKRLIGRKIVPHTKTSAGDREVYLTNEAIDLIRLIYDKNVERGFSDKQFLFLNDEGNRIQTYNIDSRIVKYCKNIGIHEKRIHKIRKTYVSTLLDNKVNIDLVRNMVGHEDERTTLESYCFNRLNKNQTNNLLETALGGEDSKYYKKCLFKTVS